MSNDSVTVAQLGEFDELIDVRSPAEFELDRIPGAINCPVLDNEERARVGTLYTQVSTFEARKVGAALIARNIARHLQERFMDRPREWKPLVYCWRGGKRSAAMTHILRQIGWDARQLSGGYKAFRRTVVDDLATLIPQFTFKVICGMTGAGKSHLLHELDHCGAQILDLEALAEHRGSLLGSLPGITQPSQKMFETRIWQSLSKLEPARPVYLESESRKVGDVRLPEPLVTRMWSSQCVVLNAPMEVRVQLLLADYQHLTEDRSFLFDRLDCLVAAYGRERIGHWKQMAEGNDWRGFVEAILSDHYDASYVKAIRKNYPNLESAQQLQLTDADSASIRKLARQLMT